MLSRKHLAVDTKSKYQSNICSSFYYLYASLIHKIRKVLSRQFISRLIELTAVGCAVQKYRMAIWATSPSLHGYNPLTTLTTYSDVSPKQQCLRMLVE